MYADRLARQEHAASPDAGRGGVLDISGGPDILDVPGVPFGLGEEKIDKGIVVVAEGSIIFTPESPRVTVFPSIVIAGPPFFSVVEPITRPSLTAVAKTP